MAASHRPRAGARLWPIVLIAIALIGLVSILATPAVPAEAGRARPTATPVPPTATPAPPTPTPGPALPGTWAAAPSMSNGRWNHSATLLQDGRVLVVGGVLPSGFTAFSYEIYNPATGSWVSGSTPEGFTGQTAVRLQDGRVLIAAGTGGGVSSYLYSPATNSWAQTGARAIIRLGGATATLLPDGRVLVAGGSPGICAYDPCPTTTSITSEIYNPATGTWSTTGTMSTLRYNHTATLLPDGRVLVVGGNNGAGLALTTAEIYDPATGIWTSIASMAEGRKNHSATLLPDGRVLVAGGEAIGLNTTTVVTSAEVYDPATQSWLSAGSRTELGGLRPATLLASGRVLVEGSTNAVIYDPATNSWAPTGGMLTPRFYHTATLLGSGKVLVTGGIGVVSASGTLASAELYTP